MSIHPISDPPSFKASVRVQGPSNPSSTSEELGQDSILGPEVSPGAAPESITTETVNALQASIDRTKIQIEQNTKYTPPSPITPHPKNETPATPPRLPTYEETQGDTKAQSPPYHRGANITAKQSPAILK